MNVKRGFAHVSFDGRHGGCPYGCIGYAHTSAHPSLSLCAAPQKPKNTVQNWAWHVTMNFRGPPSGTDQKGKHKIKKGGWSAQLQFKTKTKKLRGTCVPKAYPHRSFFLEKILAFSKGNIDSFKRNILRDVCILVGKKR